MKNSITPIISVVIPMYNVEAYIKTSLDSVLAQSFKAFEIICVDDGSPDNSVDIVKRYNDPRIRIVSQRNRGLAAARNTGINHARAPFVALLDADDYWHSDKLALHIEHLYNNPQLGVSYSASRFIDEDGNLLNLGQHPALQNITAEHILCRNPVGNGSSPVIRRLALLDIAFEQIIDGETRIAYFNEQLRQSEDIEMWIRLALNTQWQFEGLEQELTFYRVNASGLSANLEQQYASWCVAMKNNYKNHEIFFDQWLPLAEAYQKRYLARRAVQSNNGKVAISLISQALTRDIRIVTQEPIRTALTAACAVLSLLPKKIYNSLQNIAMNCLAGRSA